MQFCANRVMVVTSICARGRKTLQIHGFPIQTYGKTLKCNNFNQEYIIEERERGVVNQFVGASKNFARGPSHLRSCRACTAGSGGRERTMSTITGRR